jgi:hypothetical protein
MHLAKAVVQVLLIRNCCSLLTEVPSTTSSNKQTAWHICNIAVQVSARRCIAAAAAVCLNNQHCRHASYPLCCCSANKQHKRKHQGNAPHAVQYYFL